MSIVNLGSFPTLLVPGVNEVWGAFYNMYPEEFRDIFTEYSSDMQYERDVAMSATGKFARKYDGGGFIYDSLKQLFPTTYQHLGWGLGIIVTHEEMKDNLYAKVAVARTQALMRSANMSYNTLGANVLNYAFDSTRQTLGDGKALGATDHPIDGSTFANKPSVDLDFCEYAVEQAVIDIKGYTDNRGNIMQVKPRKLILPRQLEFDAARLINNPDRPATANRDINALYQTNAIPEGYKINNYLTNAKAWFIVTDVPDGFKFWNREPLTFREDNDDSTWNLKFQAYFRCSYGVTDPRCFYGSSGQ
jgi:hypothetical protein